MHIKKKQRFILSKILLACLITTLVVIFSIFMYKFQYTDLYYETKSKEHPAYIVYQDTEYYAWSDIRQNYIQNTNLLNAENSAYVPFPYMITEQSEGNFEKRHYLFQKYNYHTNFFCYLFGSRAYLVTEENPDIIYVDNPLPFGSHGIMYYKKDFVFPTAQKTPVESIVLNGSKYVCRVDNLQKIQNIVNAFNEGGSIIEFLSDEISTDGMYVVLFQYQNSPFSEQIGIITKSNENIQFQKTQNTNSTGDDTM